MALVPASDTVCNHIRF